MGNSEGEPDRCPIRPYFDRRLKLAFHGARVTYDAGLLAYREFDNALGTTASASDAIFDHCTGRNGWHGGTAHQGRQERGSVDPAIVPEVPQQRGSAPAPPARLQSRQLHAHLGAARCRGTVVTDQRAREAHQDRSEDRPPRLLRHVPDG